MIFLLMFIMNLFDFYILDQYYSCFTIERKKESLYYGNFIVGMCFCVKRC